MNEKEKLLPVNPVYFVGDKISYGDSLNISFPSEYDFMIGDLAWQAPMLKKAKDSIEKTKGNIEGFEDFTSTEFTRARRSANIDMMYSYAYSNTMDLTVKALNEYCHDIESSLNCKTDRFRPTMNYIAEKISNVCINSILEIPTYHFLSSNLKNYTYYCNTGEKIANLMPAKNELCRIAVSTFTSRVYSIIYSEIFEYIIINFTDLAVNDPFDTAFINFYKSCYESEPPKNPAAIDIGTKYTFISSILREKLETHLVNLRAGLHHISQNIANMIINGDTLIPAFKNFDTDCNEKYKNKLLSLLNNRKEKTNDNATKH